MKMKWPGGKEQEERQRIIGSCDSRDQIFGMEETAPDLSYIRRVKNEP